MNRIIGIKREEAGLSEMDIPAMLLTDSSFTAGTAYRIEQEESGLVLVAVEEGEPFDDWVQENGDICLTGEWLEQGALAGCTCAEVDVVQGVITVEAV